MTRSFDAQRDVLRLRLQAQRRIFAGNVSTAFCDDNYPRSVTMSLLSRRSSLAVWAVTELLPVLVVYFLGNSGHGLLHALQLKNGFRSPYNDPDAQVIRRN